MKGIVKSAIWILVIFVGYLIYKSNKSPYDIIVGIPLILIGGGFVVNNMWSSLLALFSPSFNKGMCKLCSK